MDLIFGIRAVIEAIQSQKNIDKIFIQKEAKGELMQQLLKLVKEKEMHYTAVPIEKLNKLTKNNHQGAVAFLSPITFCELETLVETTLEKKEKPLFLVLDQVSDARNFGAIIRTAECTGVDGIIIQKQGSAPVNGDTVKTSAGAVFNIPICKVNHIKDAIMYLQGSGIYVVGATEKTNQLMYDVDFAQPLAIVMGAEDKGITPSVLKILDTKAKLPMYGVISSLNVSVASGAFLYEVIRQRR